MKYYNIVKFIEGFTVYFQYIFKFNRLMYLSHIFVSTMISVTFYKRAQILVGDIWACFEGQEFGRFDDIDSITMFADYR